MTYKINLHYSGAIGSGSGMIMKQYRGNTVTGLILVWLLAVKSVLAAPVDCADSTTTGIPEYECAALVDLYDATDGANWIDSSNWKTNTAVDSWYGVSVANGSVSRLYLHGNGLVGVLPSSLGDLSQLTWLFLDVNQLSGSIPASLGNLSRLTHLVLGVNQLEGQIPGQLGNLDNLLILVLKDNLLSGSIPSELGSLASLVDLDLSGNALTGSIPAELGALPLLERMILTRNQLSGQLPDELGNLAALKILDLDNNQLNGFVPKTLGNLNNLESLELALNQLTGPVPAELGGLQRLWNLDLYGNYLTGSLPPELANLASLLQMEVQGNRLTGLIPDAFASLTGLQVFRVNSNQLDADENGNALVSSSLQSWYDGIAEKDISHQSPPASAEVLRYSTVGLVTGESGASASFSLALNTQPAFNVTITLVSSDPTEGTVMPDTLVFTPANWFASQSVVLAGVDDDVEDGNQTYFVDLAIASADTDYDGMVVDAVSAINMDDDQAGITVYPVDGLVTTEAGGADSFRVQLNTRPTADVTIQLYSSNLNEGVIDSNELLFTPDNWNIPQVVTVTGVDDDIYDGDNTYIIVVEQAVSTDPLYQGLDPDDVLVTNLDSESDPAIAGITIAPDGLLVTDESGVSDSFSVVLDSRPGAQVNIGLSSSDPDEGVASPENLIFTPDNWAVAQTVIVTGVDDAQADGDQAYRIVVASPTSGDSSYHQQFGPYNVEAINKDNDANQDQAGVNISPVGGLLTTEEETTAEFRVVLNTQPAEEVVITFASSDASEGTVNPASLVFTPADWAQAQAVTITGVADGIVDGDQPYTIVTASVSADAVYGAIDPVDVEVTNGDINSIDIVIVSPAGGIKTSEAGGADNLSLRLDSRPQGDVVLALGSSDETEGRVWPDRLVFTTENWNSLQTVTVSGQEDLELDGNRSYIIITEPAISNDVEYAGLNPPDLSAINLDNDPEPGCSSPPPDVELQSGFVPGLYLCIGDNSMRTEVRLDPASSITIENGAEVHLQAPVIELRKGFRVEEGGVMGARIP
ncbi:Calx-beta domain-containing protein [Thiolapillus sp.]